MMKTLLLLSTILFIAVGPAYAMTEESGHYQGSDARANATDDDDTLEQFSDAPRSSYSGQSGREQELLQGDTGSASSQTYGFGGYDNGWTQSRSNFGGSQPGFYAGVR